jgi:1-deoxy-D-xylulose-5-phosphate reductoisomerase
MKGLAILGSTGSIGQNVLRVVEAFPDRFSVEALAAGSNAAVLAEQVARHRPKLVSVKDQATLDALSKLVDLSGVRAVTGPAGMVEAATHEAARMVVASAVGALGLVPTYRALEAGKDVALANKETLVMAGEQFMLEAHRWGGQILPVDSAVYPFKTVTAFFKRSADHLIRFF